MPYGITVRDRVGDVLDSASPSTVKQRVMEAQEQRRVRILQLQAQVPEYSWVLFISSIFTQTDSTPDLATEESPHSKYDAAAAAVQESDAPALVPAPSYRIYNCRKICIVSIAPS